MLISTCRLMFANQDQFNVMPEGTKYTILCDDFHGKKVIAVAPETSIVPLIQIGWEDIPDGTKYDGGADFFIPGDTALSWVVKIIIDPCLGISNSDVLLSASMRHLV